LRLLALPALLAGLTFGQAVPGYAVNLSNLDIPLVMAPFFNPCTTPADAFTASGTFHMVAHATTTPSGGIHVDSMENTSDLKSDAPAVPSGSNYNVSQTDTLKVNLNSSGIIEDSATDHLSMISHGPAPSFMVHLTFHFTIHPNGTITGVVDKPTVSCK
jgi:hypothetical protein